MTEKREPKKTPWFPPNIKPVRPGVYETNYLGAGCREYSRWYGDHWGTCEYSVSNAARYSVKVGAAQKKIWRGLKEAP